MSHGGKTRNQANLRPTGKAIPTILLTVLRRTQKSNASAKTPTLVADKLISLDMEKYGATVDGKMVKLTLKEFNLIALFLKSKGMVINREMLSAQVWEQEKLTTSRTIDVHISRLRKKLGKFARVIQTVGKVGYRFSPE